MITIRMTEREFHTTIAALRCWQDLQRGAMTRGPNDQSFVASLRRVATNAGKFEGLTPSEIDVLVYRLNTEEG